jgi:hypothetical protein
VNTPNERPEIEVVLRALSAVEAPTHLGQDVARELNQSLQMRVAIQHRKRPLAFVWPSALGGISAALIALMLISYLSGPTSKSFKRPLGQGNVQQSVLATPPQSLRQPYSSAQGSAEVQVTKSPKSRQKRSAFVQAVAINHPAPVPPLTEQERLLIRVAQGRDPVQLASLNPELQDAIDTTRRNDFIKLSNGGSQ